MELYAPVQSTGLPANIAIKFKKMNFPVLFQWKEGSFTREMLRKDSLTTPILIETPNADIRKFTDKEPA